MKIETEIDQVLSKTIRSIVALTGRNLILQFIQAVAFSLLVAFLLPGEIGIFIVISSVMRIFTFFTDLGLGAALIQKKNELDKEDLSTAFTIQTILVFGVVLVGLLITPFVTSYAHLTAPGVFLYQVLVFTLFVSSLKMIPSILLERKLQFEKQIIPQIVESFIFNVMVVLLAAKHFGVASYSWSILVSSLVGLPIYFLISPWKLSLKVSLDKAKQLIRYGLPFQSKSVLAIFKDDLLTFFLSGLVGTAGIGYWGTAQRFAYYPFRLIVDSVTKVTFPAYSRIQHDNNSLRIGLEKSLFAVSLLVFPILTLISVLAADLIVLIPKYQKWAPALPSFYFLCAGAAISALSNILVNALDATGHVKTTLSLMVMWIALTWISTLLLVAKFGFTGISIASFLVTLTIFFTIILVKRVIPFSFFPNVSKPLFASALLGLTAYGLIQLLPKSFVTLGLAASSGAIIYLIIMYLIARKDLLTDLKLVLTTFKK